MRAPEDSPRFRDYVSMLARAVPIILLATLLSAGAAFVVSQQRAPSYTASALAFATVAGDPSTFSQYYGDGRQTADARLRGTGEVRAVARRAVRISTRRPPRRSGLSRFGRMGARQEWT